MPGDWMEREIAEQPALLAARAPEYAAALDAIFRGPNYELVVLAARGSSDHAALYARYLIEVHLGIPAVLAAPSILTRYHARVRYPRCLAVGISQSGSAPDVAEVLAALREDGHTTLAITNTPGSRLSREAEHTLLLDVGEERSVAATKTYAASLLALYEMVRALGELPAARTPDEHWHSRCAAAAEGDAATITGSEPSFALGRGYSFATANEAALKLMECALIPCKAYSSADFEHGPKALAQAGSAILAFTTVSPKLGDQGSLIVEPPVCPGIAEEHLPMWHAVYAQSLALACARRTGQDPDKPQFLQKVTRTL
jgi:glucosamine--fructose-6-phosphate aminotransferase (isomerizing)